MLPLAIAMSVPLFAVIIYALLSHPDGPRITSADEARQLAWARRTRSTPNMSRPARPAV
jgi:hypothetical protein